MLMVDGRNINTENCEMILMHEKSLSKCHFVYHNKQNMLRGPYYTTFIAQMALSKILINVTELI